MQTPSLSNNSSGLHALRRLMSPILRYSPSNKLVDILLWPVSRRLFGHRYEEVVRICEGAYIRVYGDMEDMVNKMLMFMSDSQSLCYEPVTARLVQFLSPKVTTVVVAGSHIGYYPLIVSASNLSATVYAFEPNPINFDRLHTNIALNNFRNITAIPAALGDKEAKQEMYFDFGQSSLLDTGRKHDGKGMVDVKRLDIFMEKVRRVPDLLILDAEGYEPRIIEGGLRSIGTGKPDIIFELNPGVLKTTGSSPEDLCNALLKLGYLIYIIEDDYGQHTNKPIHTSIKLSKFAGSISSDISYLNAFATVHPDRVSGFV